MSIEIRHVVSKRDLKKFVLFPYKLYKKNPYWVPPLRIDEFHTLRQDQNPAFEHCDVGLWLAYRNGKVVGRIAGIINRLFIEKWNKRYARFGWFDFVDDPDVSNQLIDTVEQWAKEKGMEAIHGPLGFTDLDYEGMLVEGFEELSTMASGYNYPYYPLHMEKRGYQKDVDWVEYELFVPQKPNSQVERIAALVQKRYHLRFLEAKYKKDLLGYAHELFELINVAYTSLYGVVPLTEKQVASYVKQYFGFIRPEFVPVVLDENGRMVAFGITMPSLSKALQKCQGKLWPFGFIHLLRALRKNDRADLYLVAVRPDYQKKGVNAMLIHKMTLVYQKLGITKVESNRELETNRLVQGQWKYYERRQHKRRRCFIKHFNP